MNPAAGNLGRFLIWAMAGFLPGIGLSYCQSGPSSDEKSARFRPDILKARPAQSAKADAKEENLPPGARGKRLYQEYCTPCHSLDHSDVGPAMLAIAAKYANRPEDLVAFMKYPVQVDSKLFPMPRVGLPENDLVAVAEYALKLPIKAPAILAPPSTRPAPLSPPAPAGPGPEGEAVFAKACANCHDWNNRQLGPPLRLALEKFRGQPELLIAFLKNPIQVSPEYPAMPAPAISESELQAVAEYMLAMQASEEKKQEP